MKRNTKMAYSDHTLKKNMRYIYTSISNLPHGSPGHTVLKYTECPKRCCASVKFSLLILKHSPTSVNICLNSLLHIVKDLFQMWLVIAHLILFNCFFLLNSNLRSTLYFNLSKVFVLNFILPVPYDVILPSL